MISRVCEEFGCTPSVAAQELLDDRDNLAMTIIELREYQRAYRAIEQAREHEGVEEPTGGMVEMVHEINWRILKEGRGGG